MNRKEFLSTLGLGAAAIASSYCFGGCQSNDQIVAAPTNGSVINGPALRPLMTYKTSQSGTLLRIYS